jgi:hypothetical protein
MTEITKVEELQVIKRDKNALLCNTQGKAFAVVDTINNMTLLNAQDITNLEAASKFMLSTYTDVPQYRPLAIKLASVLNDAQFPTLDAKYWQCKKEAEVHFNQLVLDYYKYERASVDIEEMDYMIASSEKQLKTQKDIIKASDHIDPIKLGFEVKRLYIKRREYIFNLKQLEKNIKYRIQEVTEWAAIAENMLAKNCSYSTSNYNQHLIESMYKSLEHKLNAANDNEKPNYANQLATLKQLITKHS